MSKLDRAIHEIQHIDSLAATDQRMNRLHPLVKLIVTIAYITVTVSFHKYQLAGLLRMGIYPIALFLISGLSFKDAVRRLWIVLPLVCFVGLFNPFFDNTPLFTIEKGVFGQTNGSWIITGGMVSMATLLLKGVFTVLAAYLLIATTDIFSICCALRSIHIPEILVTQILLTYRYLSVLLSEAGRITESYSLRAPRQKGIHFKVWGSLSGQMLLRSMDRAGDIYESMLLRGYNGNFSYKKQSITRTSAAYLLIWIILFTAIRLI